MKTLRVGVLGCGGIARRHAEAMRQIEAVELVACCDHKPEAARALSASFAGGRAEIYTDYHALIEHAGLDLLLVCIPPFAHEDEVALAAARGIHLLVEKPIALSSAQAWDMVHAAEHAGIKTQVGFMFRFGAAVERFKQEIESGAAGTVGLFMGRYFCNALHTHWWRERAKSGGQLVEQAIHLLDLVRYWMGEPESIYCRQANLYHRDVPGYTSEDLSATVANYANGALGVLCATNAAIPGRWIGDFRVVAGRLTADFTDPNHATFFFTAEPERPPEVVASDREFRALPIQDLVETIRSGGETRAPLREGAKTLDLALAAARSAEIHAEVPL